MTMTDWVYVLKHFFKCSYTENEIRNIIKARCLASPGKIYGTYCVDDQKVWEEIIENNPSLKKQMIDKRIYDYAGVIGMYEEYKYKCMRATYPKHRKRR